MPFKPPSVEQQQHTMLYNKRCAYQDCEHCGIDKRLKLTCPNDNDPNITVKVRVYVKIQRTTQEGKKFNQIELQEQDITAPNLMKLLKADLRKALPHHWDAEWDLQNRRLLYDTFDPKAAVVKTDFSATVNLIPQHQLTAAVPGHAILDVFIASHSPTYHVMPNGTLKRVIVNDVFLVWAQTTKKKTSRLKNDNYCHIKAFHEILRRLTAKVPDLEHLHVLTDGCAAQYKSRKNCYAESELRHIVPSLKTVEHRFAPTACFKTTVDGAGITTQDTTTHFAHLLAGNDAKAWLRRNEVNETTGCRAYTARLAYEACSRLMKAPPERILDKCTLHSFSSRTHLYLVDKHDATDVDRADQNTVLTDYYGDRWDAKVVDGISQVYATLTISSDNQHCQYGDLSVRKMYIKPHVCGCKECKADPTSKKCPHTHITGKWIPKSIVPVDPNTQKDDDADEPVVLDPALVAQTSVGSAAGPGGIIGVGVRHLGADQRCFCEEIHDDMPMVECNLCKVWYHFHCVAYDKGEDDPEDYHCWRCTT